MSDAEEMIDYNVRSPVDHTTIGIENDGGGR
jgi:hypothetical protein